MNAHARETAGRRALSVIIVSWNAREKLAACLESLSRYAPDAEVIVVDNASGDDSANTVRAEFPTVRLLENKSNEGFAAANNRGAAVASGRYLCFLNSDTQVGPESLDELCEHLAGHPTSGIVGPRIVLESGQIQRSYGRAPNLWTESAFFLGTVTGAIPNPFTLWRNMGFGFRSVTTPVDWVSGCCLLLRRDTFERVSGWDEDYFAYYEDVALCAKVRALGLRVLYLPSSRITHHHGASYSILPDARRILDAFQSAQVYLSKSESEAAARCFRVVTTFGWKTARGVLRLFRHAWPDPPAALDRKIGLASDLLRGKDLVRPK